MHKKTNRSSSLFDEDDDEDETFGRNSNRFLKTKDRPKNDFQRELESKVTFRSLSPKSVDTDSDLGESNHENSLKTSGNSKYQRGGSDWQPNLEKSPGKSLRSEESKISNSPFEKSNKNSKSNLSKQKPIFDENSDDLEFPRQSKIRFSKSSRDEKSGFGKEFSSNEINLQQGDQKNRFLKNDFNEKKKDTYDENDSFSKTIRFKDSEKVSQLFDEIKKTEKKVKTQNKFEINDEEDSVNDNSSRFLKTQKTKTAEDKSNKSEFGSFSKSKNKFDMDDSDYDLKSTKFKETKDRRDKLNSDELEGSSKFIPNNSKNKFHFSNDLDKELSNSSRYMSIDQTNNDEKFKSDIKPKPRKSQIKNLEHENEQFSLKNEQDNKFNHTQDEQFSLKNKKDNKYNHSQDDNKIRRSIRFEDEIFDPFTKNSKTSSREGSPRKSDVSRESSRMNSPSPQTSICEEVIHDPFTHKNETIKKKLEEEKREKESKFESPHNKLINHSINSVADCQNEIEPKQPPISLKKTTTRPTSAKYRNVQPKVTTRINLKSARPLSINNEWLSSPNLNSDSDNINSERLFTDSQTIRETAYLQWYLTKLSEKNSKKSIENIEEKKKKSSDEERIAAYEAWKKAKHDHFKELDRKRKEEIKKNEKSETPENKENKSAEIAFEVWKKQKQESLKEELKVKAKEEKQKKLKLTKEYQEKDSKRTILINEWKQKKDKELQEKKLLTQKEDKEQKTQKENETKNKLVDAEKAYKEWEEKTERKIKKYCEFEKTQAELINNRRAWRPSNNAIIKTRRI